eukprot:TRINITY_DN21174_c0_g1_i1.p1 TRINITY_DN21174_c0_g1~~TRINITY_DN21174_c0_g1_i1.p1  ORF type:complete len:179 (+),score=12.78 TRINITY_DN21174_c0_g1_i1:61-537(+)
MCIRDRYQDPLFVSLIVEVIKDPNSPSQVQIFSKNFDFPSHQAQRIYVTALYCSNLSLQIRVMREEVGEIMQSSKDQLNLTHDPTWVLSEFSIEYLRDISSSNQGNRSVRIEPCYYLAGPLSESDFWVFKAYIWNLGYGIHLNESCLLYTSPSPRDQA